MATAEQPRTPDLPPQAAERGAPVDYGLGAFGTEAEAQRGGELERARAALEGAEQEQDETATNLEAALGAPSASGAASVSPAAGADTGVPGPGAAAALDLNDSVLKGAGAGGAGADFGTGPTAGDIGGAHGAGLGASLGQGANAPPLFKAPGGAQPMADNEQQDARKAHGLAQGGAGASQTAPDQTRAQGTLGSINETDGL